MEAAPCCAFCLRFFPLERDQGDSRKLPRWQISSSLITGKSHTARNLPTHARSHSDLRVAPLRLVLTQTVSIEKKIGLANWRQTFTSVIILRFMKTEGAASGLYGQLCTHAPQSTPPPARIAFAAPRSIRGIGHPVREQHSRIDCATHPNPLHTSHPACSTHNTLHAPPHLLVTHPPAVLACAGGVSAREATDVDCSSQPAADR